MSVGFLVFVNVDRSQFDGVFLGDGRSLFFFRKIRFLSICFADLERRAWISLFARTNERAALVFQDLPMREHLVVRRQRSGANRGLGQIFVEQVVLGGVRATVGIVLNIDALRTIQRAAPASVKVERVSNPGAIDIVIFVHRNITKQVKLCGARLVISIRNVLISEGVGTELELPGKILIHVPTDQLEIIAVSVDEIEAFAVIHTEGRRLPAHVGFWRASRHVGMQERTVLCVVPLGVNDKAAFGHGQFVKFAGFSASSIQIPTAERVADWCN